MRFDELPGLTTLPADRAGSIFCDEPVLTVLPASEPGSGEASLLVATPSKLGVATLRKRAGRSRWVIRWAPWDAVGLGRRVAAASSGRVGITVRVGGRTFLGTLPGRPGRAALRDFGRTVRGRRSALGLPEHAR